MEEPSADWWESDASHVLPSRSPSEQPSQAQTNCLPMIEDEDHALLHLQLVMQQEDEGFLPSQAGQPPEPQFPPQSQIPLPESSHEAPEGFFVKEGGGGMAGAEAPMAMDGEHSETESDLVEPSAADLAWGQAKVASEDKFEEWMINASWEDGVPDIKLPTEEERARRAKLLEEERKRLLEEIDKHPRGSDLLDRYVLGCLSVYGPYSYLIPGFNIPSLSEPDPIRELEYVIEELDHQTPVYHNVAAGEVDSKEPERTRRWMSE